MKKISKDNIKSTINNAKNKAKEKIPKIKKEKEKKKAWKSVLNIILVCAIAVLGLILAFILYIIIFTPNFVADELYQKEPTVLYDVNGAELLAIGGADAEVLTFDEIPDVMIDALIATEDSRFFQHNGVDLFRFLKASVKQLLGSSDAGGASTITMQLSKNKVTKKNKSENRLQSFIRKFQDIYVSVFKIESKYTKEEILEFYLNSQWFANDGNIYISDGITGIEKASEYYFGKSAKDLNLAETSLLAGMFQNPNLYNPIKNPEGCRNRQKIVLTLMVRHGYITEEQKNDVLSIPVTTLITDGSNTETATKSSQAFIDYVLNEVEDDLKIDPRSTSLKIYTTFDPKVQAELEKVEKGEVYSFPNEIVEEGIAVTSVENGSITALSGGRNYQARGLNLSTDMSRQPGSTAKPLFDYAMYIEHITQSTYDMILDEPTTYSNGSKIGNYDGKYKGLITMRYAIEDSRNIPALRTFKKVAAYDKSVISDFVHSVGIDYGSDLYESASIGAFNGVSPLELSAAYASFSRGGYYIKPYGYTKVINNEDGTEYNNSYTKEKVMEESTAYLVTNILVGTYGGKGVSGTQIGGKTGTTNLDSDTKKKYGLPNGAVMDAWIVSYSPSYSIALWYGYDRIRPNAKEDKLYLTSTTGGQGRRTIMNALATGIYPKGKTFNVPKTVTSAEIELETFPGQLCSAYTPKDLCSTEYYVVGTEPTDVSSRFNTLDNPTNGTSHFNGTTITLSWDKISTPSAIDTNYLNSFFKENYEEYADKYYNLRLEYNNTNIGTIGYEIYLVDSNNNETYLGYTKDNTYSYNAILGNTYKFRVKSAYSIFKQNMSSGLDIEAKASIGELAETIFNR